MTTNKDKILRVDPIRTLPEIARVKAVLKDHPRNYAILIFGINTALRASDIVKLTRQDLRGLKAGDILPLRMKKTKKIIDITLNEDVIAAIKPLMIEGDGPLFASENDPSRGITEQHLCRLVQDWCEEARLKGHFGSHSMRKTFAIIQRTVFKVDWPTISQLLGHSSLKETQLYLGVQPEEVKQAFMNRI
jgi:integrase